MSGIGISTTVHVNVAEVEPVFHTELTDERVAVHLRAQDWLVSAYLQGTWTELQAFADAITELVREHGKPADDEPEPIEAVLDRAAVNELIELTEWPADVPHCESCEGPLRHDRGIYGHCTNDACDLFGRMFACWASGERTMVGIV